jgi:hypothetical protein
MHKDRPARITHFGLRVRESGPLKLAAKATTPIGNLVSKIIINDERHEAMVGPYKCMADDITDQ